MSLAPHNSTAGCRAADRARPGAFFAGLREVWSIAWPTVLTMASYTVMQFIDKLMVGQVGAIELAAQTGGGIWSFAPIAFALGLLTVVNTYVAQHLGAGSPQEGPKYAWAAIWVSLAYWLFIMLPWALILPFVFAHMEGHSPRLKELETGYAQILVLGSVVLLASRGLNHYFFGLHRPRIVTLAAITGNIVNVLGNYILILGERGLGAVTLPGGATVTLPGIPGTPALGVYGAAIATVIGTCVELLIPLSVFLGRTMNNEFATRRTWRVHLAPIRDLFKIGWPGAVQFGNELLCWAIFMTVLVGAFGPEHLAACAIAFGYMHLSFMPAVGFSVAVTSLVGKYIGAGQPDIAVVRARQGVSVAMLYMTACAIVFFVFRQPLVAAFVPAPDPSLPPEEFALAAARAEQIIALGTKLMICAALFQTADAFGIVYSGALRGAGDTVWPGIITFIYSWAFIVLGGWAIKNQWPELESIGPWIGASIFIVMYGITMWLRFRAGAWRSIQLIAPSDAAERDAARIAPLGPAAPATSGDAVIRDMAEELTAAGKDGS